MPGDARPLHRARATRRRTGTVFPGELEHCAGKRGCPIIAGAGCAGGVE